MTARPLHIIFDLDGTLFDTEYEVARITAELATAKGCPISAATVFNQFAGYGSKEKFAGIARLHGRSFSDAELKELRQQHTDGKQALYDQPVIPVIDYVPEMLAKLQQAGHTLSVASANKTPRIRQGLDKTGLRHHFNDRAYGPDLTGDRKKPDPAVFLLAMAENGATPENTVIVEDSEAGLLAGRAAGAFVIAYLDPRFGTGAEANAKKQDFIKAGADRVIRSYAGFTRNLPQR